MRRHPLLCLLLGLFALFLQGRATAEAFQRGAAQINQ